MLNNYEHFTITVDQMGTVTALPPVLWSLTINVTTHGYPICKQATEGS